MVVSVSTENSGNVIPAYGSRTSHVISTTIVRDCILERKAESKEENNQNCERAEQMRGIEDLRQGERRGEESGILVWDEELD